MNTTPSSETRNEYRVEIDGRWFKINFVPASDAHPEDPANYGRWEVTDWGLVGGD